jgi:DNA-binding response OmpR family regulator
MPKPSEKILIADEDPDVIDLVARQALGPMGYKVAAASDGPGAIQHVMTFKPDIVIASLTLLGLSAKEILVALRSQGLESLVIVTAPEGQEKAALQAFRLGAKDYLAKPLREAEVVSSVERALSEVRLRKEREALALSLSEANAELEHRVKELTLLYGIGKAIVSLNHLDRLYDRLMGLKRFKIAQVCRSIMVAPIKAKNESLGVISVGRKEAREFSAREQAMLEAVADYASIAMINARLFRALESRAAPRKPSAA